jgi:hypothetical protein
LGFDTAFIYVMGIKLDLRINEWNFSFLGSDMIQKKGKILFQLNFFTRGIFLNSNMMKPQHVRLMENIVLLINYIL